MNDSRKKLETMRCLRELELKTLELVENVRNFLDEDSYVCIKTR